jgi:hypothetical protein
VMLQERIETRAALLAVSTEKLHLEKQLQTALSSGGAGGVPHARQRASIVHHPGIPVVMEPSAPPRERGLSISGTAGVRRRSVRLVGGSSAGPSSNGARRASALEDVVAFAADTTMALKLRSALSAEADP